MKKIITVLLLIIGITLTSCSTENQEFLNELETTNLEDNSSISKKRILGNWTPRNWTGNTGKGYKIYKNRFGEYRMYRTNKKWSWSSRIFDGHAYYFTVSNNTIRVNKKQKKNYQFYSRIRMQGRNILFIRGLKLYR